ncbi:signaling protein [Corynebacterium phocae]|uniref:Zinc metalloprotease Rip1 n=1 Tax=Corynebacterium phocae TaxID=161895 RepID=A0A1L7D2L7_9CORY|nr:M50 family metallopeptidase [Corynebacterium phocae]APT92323.1 signaling protein [Corynebacterium phocae]KAA8724913.1 site-2 protease family protein [Corynebacterium phocae]
MANIIGIVLFALGIGVTIALHEAGHMYSARAFGMRVRRFSIGFGPKLVGFKAGKTEYSLAALPVGGFCDIAGMIPNDENLTAEEAPHAMYKKPAWQRIVVMSGGIAVNIVLGFSILFGIALTAGIPDMDVDIRPQVGAVTCSADQIGPDSFQECQGTGPAGRAGVQPGDVILAVDGTKLESFAQLRDAVIDSPGEPVVLTIERGGRELEMTVTPETVTRFNAEGQPFEAGSIGLVNKPLDIIVKHDNPVSAAVASAKYSAYMAKSTVIAIGQIPAKVPGILASIFGAERAQDSPMSVVGASRLGGELVERDLWASFFMMLASLNYFLALFNLIPLPPFDGGHIAVICYEKIRNLLRWARGLAPKGAVDYRGLMPITYVMAALLMGFGALVIVADVVNPIRIFG